MSLRNTLWIAALAVGATAIPVFAAGSTSAPGTPATFVRTYVFPATGFAPGSETVRISVVNIAATSHNGTKASCSGNIGFQDATGTSLGTTPFTNVGTGQIAVGDYAIQSPVPLHGRSEIQGRVQVTLTAGSAAPCSLLLTLEVFDTASGVTHGLVTTAIEEPVAMEPSPAGRH